MQFFGHEGLGARPLGNLPISAIAIEQLWLPFSDVPLPSLFFLTDKSKLVRNTGAGWPDHRGASVVLTASGQPQSKFIAQFCVVTTCLELQAAQELDRNANKTQIKPIRPRESLGNLVSEK